MAKINFGGTFGGFEMTQIKGPKITIKKKKNNSNFSVLIGSNNSDLSNGDFNSLKGLVTAELVKYRAKVFGPMKFITTKVIPCGGIDFPIDDMKLEGFDQRLNKFK